MLLKKIEFTRIFLRLFCKKVRVRFAPSPTGILHIGGLRTALYNYLFAHKNQGKFILRIEDTDKDRAVYGATENICDILNWAGIIPDESPTSSGSYGPYVQSQRKEIYQDKVQELLKAGAAYYCFCSERRLSELKAECRKSRTISKYDGNCRSLTASEVEKKLTENKNYTIRLKISSDVTHFHDMVYGDITKNVADQDGDPVLMKSDGNPTYHFANVVDDHLMEITHVLRGNEWLVSAPKHIKIYEAFGWHPPKFAHIPLMLKMDGKKFSKREDDLQVNSFKDRGIFPEALINFITSSSSGFVNHDPKSIYPLLELAKKFDVETMKTNSCKLDFKKLDRINQLWMQKKMTSEEDMKRLIESISKLIIRKFPEYIKPKENKDYIFKVLNILQGRINTINDIVKDEYSFFWKFPQIENSEFFKVTKDAELYLDVAETALNGLNLDVYQKPKIIETLERFSATNNLDFNKLRKIIRLSYSGAKDGLPVGDALQVLGKFHSLECIKISRKLIKGESD